MNCPRCGERMFGSVCPRCGNVVVSERRTPVRNNVRNINRNIDNNDGVKFMDNNRIRPVKRKKPALSSNIYKIAVVVLAVLCIVLFVMYKNAGSKLSEAESTINTLNASIKAKDEEITKLKTAEASTENAADGEDNGSDDADAPSVEFDENGNVINIDENGGSSDDSEDSDTKEEYKSGDTYVIKAGDSGSSICNEVYGKYSAELWEKLLSANGMTTSTSYHPGDELKIP